MRPQHKRRLSFLRPQCLIGWKILCGFGFSQHSRLLNFTAHKPSTFQLIKSLTLMAGDQSRYFHKIFNFFCCSRYKSQSPLMAIFASIYNRSVRWNFYPPVAFTAIMYIHRTPCRARTDRLQIGNLTLYQR